MPLFSLFFFLLSHSFFREMLTAPCIPSRALRESLELDSPAAAVQALFASAPVASLRVPSLWPVSKALPHEPVSSAQVAWSGTDGLLVLFAAGAPFRTARDDPRDKMSILKDSRVEVFVAPTQQSEQTAAAGQSASATADAPAASSAPLTHYFGYEMNASGRTLDFRVDVPRRFDYEWSGHAELLAAWDEGKVSFMLMQLPWSDFCPPALVQRIIELSVPRAADGAMQPPIAFHLGLYRGEAVQKKEQQQQQQDEDEMIWQSWIDPLSAEVAFHKPETFGLLTLTPAVLPTASASSSPASALSLLSDADAATESLSDVSLICPPGLFQGSLSSLSLRTFRAYGITRVLNAAAGSVKAPQECYAKDSGVEEFQLCMEDDLQQDLFNVRAPEAAKSAAAAAASADKEPAAAAANIVDAARWVAQCLSAGHKVLVHCAQGKSRSSAVTIFYLMRSHRIPYDKAMRMIKAARPNAQPNDAFETQLQRWSRAEELEEEAAAAAGEEDALPMPPAGKTWKQRD